MLPTTPTRQLTPRRVATLAVLLLLLAGIVIAVNQPGGILGADEDMAGSAERSMSVDSAKAAPSQGIPDIAYDTGATALAEPGPPPVAGARASSGPMGDAGNFVVPGAQRIVRTAELRVKVVADGFQAAFDRASSIAATNGGFVAGSSTASFGPPEANGREPAGKEVARSGELTLRVPADRFESVRQALVGLGEVESQSIRGEDVSGQLVDYEARLRSLGAQEEAMRALLGKAVAIGEVLQVQSQLFSTRQQIEQLEAQRADLDQRASLATIAVSLFEPGATLLPEPVTGLAHSLERAAAGALAVVGGVVVALGWSLPLVALGVVVWAALRVRRRMARPATS